MTQAGEPEVVGADGIDAGAWEAYVARHPEATVYHTPGWARVLTEAFGFRGMPVFARRGGRVCGLLPLFTRRGRRLSSSPLRDRGGVLADDDACAQALLEAAADRGRRMRVAHVAVKQYTPAYAEVFEAAGFRRQDYWQGSAVALPEDADTLWRRLDNRVRGKVRQAGRRGAELDVATDARAAADFHEMFWRTRRDLRVPTYPRVLFERIAGELGPQGKACFLFARADGRRVAGMVVLAHGGVAIDAYAASLREARSLRPNDFLVWSAIQWAIREGCHTFDFGADAPDQETLLKFKAKWTAEQGGVPHYYAPVTDRDLPDPNPAGGFLAGVAGKVFAHLPGGLYRGLSRAALGLWLRRT